MGRKHEEMKRKRSINPHGYTQFLALTRSRNFPLFWLRRRPLHAKPDGLDVGLAVAFPAEKSPGVRMVVAPVGLVNLGR